MSDLGVHPESSGPPSIAILGAFRSPPRLSRSLTTRRSPTCESMNDAKRVKAFQCVKELQNPALAHSQGGEATEGGRAWRQLLKDEPPIDRPPEQLDNVGRNRMARYSAALAPEEILKLALVLAVLTKCFVASTETRGNLAITSITSSESSSMSLACSRQRSSGQCQNGQRCARTDHTCCRR
ncbi:hypothetical protein TgHK011_009399 [Trichoderma gracile]|nr:hypothetical protein TgHK011_009399 [Trichoderma gracile]